MKKNKILFLMLLTVMISFFSSYMVKADDLSQSDDNVMIDLYHSHTSKCDSSVWIPCGGHFSSNYDSHYGTTMYFCSNNGSNDVVNGVVLSSIHHLSSTDPGVYIHSGEYVTRRNCSKGKVASLSISKEVNDGKVYLKTQIDANDDCFSSPVIQWSYNGEIMDIVDVSTYENNCTEYLVNRNGTYEATIKWYDTKTESERSNSITYTELSIPIPVKLMVNGEVYAEMIMNYNDMLPEIEIPERTGYIFDGFYHNDTMIYDSEGKPTSNANVKWLDESVSLEAHWIAKTYEIHYGEDLDEDGFGDESFIAVYGESYSDIEIENIEDRFIGYGFGDNIIFDSEGKATGVWSWDVDATFELEKLFYQPVTNTSDDNDNNSKTGNEYTKETENSNKTDNNDIISKKIDNGDENSSLSENSVSENDIDGEDGNNQDKDKSGNKRDNQRNRGGNDNLDRNNDFDNDNMDNENDENADSLGDIDVFNDFEDDENGLVEEKDEIEENIDDIETEQDLLDELADNNGNNEINVMPVEDETQNIKIDELLSNEGKNKEKVSFLERKDAVKIVVEITGIVLGGIAIVSLLIWYMLLVFASAQVYTRNSKDKLEELGRVIIWKKGKNYYINLRNSLLEKSDTGSLEIRFSGDFVRKNNNASILVKQGDNVVGEAVKSVIKYNYDTKPTSGKR